MISVVLVHPEIPPNTGNVIRLCANTGAELHLVEPLGFSLHHSQLRRAGLDYREYADIRVHASWEACRSALSGRRLWAVETSGSPLVHECQFAHDDVLVFGCETRGLPDSVANDPAISGLLRLPMCPGNRSLNLSNAVAVCVFEAWRQLNFVGAEAPITPTNA
jgi:tRNA (cytidine/uridine-2'-O-)-methyltransferase